MDTVEFWPGNRLSYTTTRIELYCNDTFLSYATGFTFKYAMAYGLITNYHVLSGINPATNQVLSKTGAIPNRIECHVTVQTSYYVAGKLHEELFFKPMSVQLEDPNGDQIWFSDRELHPHNDYAILRLEPLLPELAVPGVSLRCITGGRVTLKRGVQAPSQDAAISPESVQHYYPQVGERVFVLGYPHGINSTGIFPIWKGATLASEPFTGVTLGSQEYENVFYIDSTTKSGMSGSPVVVLGRDDTYCHTDDGTLVHGRQGSDFIVGLYSGRDGVTQEEYEISLGRVWKISAIEALFNRTLKSIAPIPPLPPENR